MLVPFFVFFSLPFEQGAHIFILHCAPQIM